MLVPVFALFMVGLIVIASESLWKLGILRREAGRKFIHILTGIWVATWPFFLSFKTIFVLAMVLLGGVIVVRWLKLGKSIHTIERLSSGDILFPFGIALSSLLTSSPWIFAAAVLNIGLADGLAGLVGSHYSFLEYKVFGHKKSVLGTLVFFLASAAILATVFNYDTVDSMTRNLVIAIMIVPTLTAVAENISPLGIDNLTVPLITIFLLNSLTV